MDLLSHEAGLKRDCFIENVPVSVGLVREVSKEAVLSNEGRLKVRVPSGRMPAHAYSRES